MYWGAVCGATLKPLHLHNPSTRVGNMEVAYRLENMEVAYRLENV